MVIAQMESETRTWTALGNTKEEAIESIRQSWNSVQHQLVQKGWINTPTIYGNIRKLEENYDIYTFDIEIGQCVSY